jgi:two-component sensor histidine kinase
MIQTAEMVGTEHPQSEADLLLREFSHRINNEFASAIGVISRAASRCESKTTKAVLEEVQDQLYNHAQVHHALQMPEYSTLTEACAYLQQLCRVISRSKLEPNGIKLIFGSDSFWMEAERCWRLGLIVSELVTNAARHAFRGPNGIIRVEIQPSSSSVHCRVTDNGYGNAEGRPGRGLKIVQALASSLGGTIDHHFTSEGTVVSLVFPVGSVAGPVGESVPQHTSLLR